MFIRFDVICERDGRTDGHCMTAKTHTQRDRCFMKGNQNKKTE